MLQCRKHSHAELVRQLLYQSIIFHRRQFSMDAEIGGILYGTRRNLRRVALFSLMLAAFVSALQAQTTRIDLRIGVVTPRAAATPTEIATLKGIRLGVAEATQTATLFGDAVEAFEARGDATSGGAVKAAEFLSSARKVQILIAVAVGDAETLSRFAEQHGLIFLNVASRSDQLRAACRRNSFHIQASDVMYSNAARLSASAPGASVELWDRRLERFGASQLNDRYRAVAHEGMDGGSWAGWAAVKIASEAALRARSTEPSRIRSYLESRAAQFDGHKGWPLSFRADDHQLRQPLYMVVESGGAPRIIDIPDLRSISSASNDNAAIVSLDKLSAGTSRQCSRAAR
jgi:ABC-type branched-subunit amino acid transport system substrate-binding protein